MREKPQVCEECGKIFIREKNREKYCPRCKEIPTSERQYKGIKKVDEKFLKRGPISLTGYKQKLRKD